MADLTKGANHFRTPISKGIEIMDNLRGHISGLAVPHFVIDAPGGGGKIPILPNYVVSQDEDKIVLRNFKYNVYEYPDVKEEKVNPKVEENMKTLKKNIEERQEKQKRTYVRKVKLPVLNNQVS